MKKIIIIYLIILINITGFILFGWLVKHYTENDSKRFKNFENVILNIATIPYTIMSFFKEDKELVFKNKNGEAGFSNFTSEIKFKEYFVSFSSYNKDLKRFTIKILDIKKEKVIFEFDPEIKGNRVHYSHALLLEDGNFIVKSDNTPGLHKINTCGKILWQVDGNFHHSIEIDKEQNIFVPNRIVDSKYGQTYLDDSISKISKDGTILYNKSITDLILENNINFISNYIGDDPIHLNDIQPALEDDLFWKKDDLFISIRNMDAIFIYRPSSKKITWFKQGPWSMQHDVDIHKNGLITIYDNNVRNITRKKLEKLNRIVQYDFSKDNYDFVFNSAFEKNNINSYTGSLHEIIDDQTIFIEEKDEKRFLLANQKGKIYWQFLSNTYMSWPRIYKAKNYKEVIKNIIDYKCS